MGFQNIWYSHPRKYGQGSRSCRACSNRHGLIRKYGLNICRQCFREYAADIGFKKVAGILILYFLDIITHFYCSLINSFLLQSNVPLL
ncbi:Ribosomal S14 domain containing protein [Asbolus verrucosus]|uniref:Small ribosomal subunit protein uS14 n=1 Tax=Asbolus verrucosus TaxID=1661398 RepID=A0A482VXR9_ASBVE|nr:Ribosomal S14 domain containing protein [Asbolus verrucosus]